MLPLSFYNTLTRRREEFKPGQPGRVGLYACGPTVYNYMHIGNLRTYVFVDVLRRVLERAGYAVTHVMNITDVGHLSGDVDTGEDKMLLGAVREQKTVWELAAFYTDAFLKDMARLHLLPPHHLPKATDHIGQMVAMIQELEAKGFTYVAGGNVYFDTSKFVGYGDLGQLVDDDASAQARVALDPHKKNQRDFVLWFTKSKFQDQEMKWDSPWGVGYPGWHIECSAMATHYLGTPIDIHTGGVDHITVHHTNERAQSEAACGCQPWVRYWLHGEFLLTNDQKMAKSADNFITVDSIVAKGFDPLVFRYFTYSAHYRTKLNFTWDAMSAAQSAFTSLQRAVREWGAPGAAIADVTGVERFNAAVSDDLNMPQALAVVWEVVKSDLSPAIKRATINDFDHVLGLGLRDLTSVVVPAAVHALVDQRQQARADKDFSRSDQLRAQIEAAGYSIEDTPSGPVLNPRT